VRIHPPIPATVWSRVHPARGHLHGWPGLPPVEDALEGVSHVIGQKPKHIPQGKMKFICCIPTADFYAGMPHEIIPQYHGCR
jgi:hypothetical protein